MEVILLERIERLGQMGDVVKVKTGYARNYLLPQKKGKSLASHALGNLSPHQHKVLPLIPYRVLGQDGKNM